MEILPSGKIWCCVRVPDLMGLKKAEILGGTTELDTSCINIDTDLQQSKFIGRTLADRKYGMA